MRKWILGLPRTVADGLIQGASFALVALAAGAVFAAVKEGGTVSAVWLAVVGALCLVLLATAVALAIRTRRYRNERSLQAAYAQVLYQALETLQKNVHDRRDINVDEVIEKGLLQPFRDLLLDAVRGKDVRLSILVLSGGRWRMLLQAGHRLESQRAFDLAYEQSFSRFAWESGEIEWSNNLEDDHRFREHPEARPERAYRSIVSIPLLVAERPSAIFNIIGSARDAFDEADIFYIQLAGSIVNIAWALREDRTAGSDQTTL